MNKKHVSLILRLVISIGLIVYFVNSLANKYGGVGEAYAQFSASFSGASLAWLFPAGLLHIVGFSLMSLRWKILLSAQDAHSSFGQLFKYYFMASFFNNFLPSTIGGDTVRVMEAKKLTGNTTTSVMVVLIERLTGLLALVLIAATGLVISFFRNVGQDKNAWLLLVPAFGTFIAVLLLAHPKVAPRILSFTKKFLPAKIQAFLERAYAAVEIYYKRPGSLLTAQGISVIFQLNMVLYYYLIAKALNQNPDPVDFMVKIPIVIFLLMMVPAINGLGVRTASFKGLMKFPATYALAAECIDLAFRIGYGLIGGVVFLFNKKQKDASGGSPRAKGRLPLEPRL